jgi:hypothetical protein
LKLIKDQFQKNKDKRWLKFLINRGLGTWCMQWSIHN